MRDKLKLILTFKNSLGKEVSYTIENCPSDITGATVKTAMEGFISTNVLDGNGGDLKEIVGAVVMTIAEKPLRLS